jgi:hypothetical protein
MEGITMQDNIKKLIEATKDINVCYHLAYTEHGHPDIGVRKEGADKIEINDTFWFISGDIVSNVTGRTITDVSQVKVYNANAMRINLRAQTSICGKIVQVHLGSRRIVEKRDCNDEGGVLVLA